MSDAFDPIEQAIADIAAGRPVVVVDDEDRENEGDLIFAAELATPEMVAFMIREHRGLHLRAAGGASCDRLDLPQMYHTNQDRRGTAFTVSVDARGTASAPASRPPTGRTPSGCSPTRPPARRPRPARPRLPAARPRRAACCAGPATPRPASTWPGSPGCARPARSARSPTRTAPCCGCPSWCRSRRARPDDHLASRT